MTLVERLLAVGMVVAAVGFISGKREPNRPSLKAPQPGALSPKEIDKLVPLRKKARELEFPPDWKTIWQAGQPQSLQ